MMLRYPDVEVDKVLIGGDYVGAGEDTGEEYEDDCEEV